MSGAKTKAELLAEREDLRTRLAELEKKKEALEQSEARFRLAAEASHTLVYDIYAHSGINIANEGIHELLGYRRGEVEITHDWWMMQVHPEEIQAYRKTLDGVLAHARDCISRYRIRHKDGHYITVRDSSKVITDESGRAARIVGGIVDITEHKQAQENLEKTRTAALRQAAQFKAVFESLHQPVMVFDDTGKPIRMNAAAREVFGADVTGTDGEKYLRRARKYSRHPDLRPMAPEEFPFRRALRGETVRGERYVFTDCQGQDRIFEVSGTPLTVQDQIVGSVVVWYDVTAREKRLAAARDSRDELEIRVQERTADLTLANQALQAEIEERKQVQAALAGSEKQLRILSVRLMEVQEEERKRISREIHDSLGQTLSAIKFRVETMLAQVKGSFAGLITRPLEDLIPIIRQSIDEARSIQSDLRPMVLDDMGILATLNWFCREYRNTYPAIQLEKQLQVEEELIPESLKTAVYRIVQEAMNNIAKHSGGNAVTLSLTKAGKDCLELVIRDNGRGFDPQKLAAGQQGKPGLGLASMRERAELSRGQFSLESSPGAGTTIRASWPI